MIYALVARILERIPTIKDLIKRLTQDFMFRLDCGFLFSDRIPSEASFSRLTSKLSDSTALELVQESLLLQAIQEGFVCDEAVAIDATHFSPETVPLLKRKSQRKNQKCEDVNQRLYKKPSN
jgi:transposase